jgi:capsular polysaccharide biosynthesis protein
MNNSQMATDLEKRQQGEQFTVMDAANLPDAPFSPKRNLFLGSGAGFGLVLGLAIAALLEYRDTSLRSDRDVWAFTKLPTLGVIGYSATAVRQARERGGRKRWFRSPFKRPRQIADAQG